MPWAWQTRGVTDPDAVFAETMAFRARAGDPLSVSRVARSAGTPYLKITRIRFDETVPTEGQGGEYVEITNLGGAAQDLRGWTVRSPARDAAFALPAVVLAAGGSCTLYTGMPGVNPGGACRAFTTTDRVDAPPGAAPLTDVWPNDGGTVVLFDDELMMPGDETRYSADPQNQPPPPHLQGVEANVDPPRSGSVAFILGSSQLAYAVGSPIDFRMVLQNRMSEQTLTFRSSQNFDLTISTDTGALVWRWSSGRVFTQALRTLTLPPGDEQMFAARWDQRSDAGAPVGPGVYQAVAVLTTTEGVLSNTVTFLIH
jgi:hypothetical protein